MNKSANHRYKAGFTIVELLVVIVVIGILAAITVVSYTGINKKAIVASLQSDLSGASDKLKMYSAENGTYPSDVTLTNGEYCPTPADTRYCFKLSSGNTKESYTSTTSSFTFVIKNDTNYWSISDNSGPVAVIAAIGQSFVTAYGGTVNDYGKSIIQTTDGGFAITGQTSSYSAGDFDTFISKYAADGTLSWTKTWGGTSADANLSIIQTTDGGFATAGYTASYGSGANDVLLSKYAADGTLSWTKTWGGAGNDTGFSIVQTTDGGFALTGYTESYGSGSYDIFLIKYTSSGALSWSKVMGGSGADWGYSLIQTTDGGFALTGMEGSYSDDGSYDIFLAKLTSSGVLSWFKTWDGPSSYSDDNGQSLIQTTDGGFAITGTTSSFGPTGYDMLLIKYNADGTLAWNTMWVGPNVDYGITLTQTSDSGFVVSGYTTSYGAGDRDVLLAKYTSGGVLLWSKTWGSTGIDSGSSIIQTNDNGFAITGYTNSYGVGGYEIFLAKYNSNGIIANCSSPACQSPTPTIVNPSSTTANPTPTIVNPSPTTSSPPTSTNSPLLTRTTIVAP